MKREYKYRGKRVDNGEWVKGYLVPNNRKKYRGEDNNFVIMTDIISPHRVVCETIGQSSGINDGKGQRIYEGDIVRWVDSDGNRRTDTVTWKNGGLVLCNSQYTVGAYIDKWLVVIGNIHDNPELKKYI